MNFEAWQSQQKALKDEERKRQKAAAENLQSYRGSVSAEDKRLAVLREEERKKKLQSEEQLRSYRASLSEQDRKLLEMKEIERQQKLDAERSLQNWGSVSEGLSSPELVGPNPSMDPSQAIGVSVSAMADKFSGERMSQ